MDQQIHERLGNLEVRQTKLETTMENVGAQLTRLTDAVTRIDNNFNQSQRPDLQTWIAGLALLIGILASYSGIFIKPIQLQIDYERAQVTDLQKDINGARQKLNDHLSQHDSINSSLSERLTKLEVIARVAAPDLMMEN